VSSADRATPVGVLVTADTRLDALAKLWLQHLEPEARVETTTTNEYQRILDGLVFAKLGGLRLRE
jgi:hypothetical protein